MIAKARLAARGIALVSTEAARAGYSRAFARSGAAMRTGIANQRLDDPVGGIGVKSR